MGGFGAKQARKLVGSPNTENSEGAPEPAGSRNEDPKESPPRPRYHEDAEGVPPRLRHQQKVWGEKQG